MQTEIHELFSTRPIPPVISVRGITQTSITIQWDPLQLFRADQLFTIEVFKNNQKLTVIPVGTSAKLTGLDVNQSYQVFIRCKTSAGLLKSNDLTVKTHSLDNLTGINVSFGEFPGGGGAEVDKLIDLVYKMGATYSEDLSADNTHLVCIVPKGPKFEKAKEWNIPAVSPDFLKACQSNSRIQPAHSFYVHK